jgi:long-chain acyl-CoA synthetase
MSTHVTKQHKGGFPDMNSHEQVLKIPEEKNFALLVRKNAARFGQKTAMRYKTAGEWKEISWTELGGLIQSAAKALVELGVKEGEMVSVFSQNRPQCTIVDVAAASIRAVSVPIYPTNTARQAEYIVRDADVRVIFVGAQDQYEKTSDFFGKIEGLAKIVAFDRKIKLRDGDGSMYFDEFIKTGEASSRDAEIEERLGRASQDDLLTLIYTSGTTGEPKGVMLTHSNLAHCAAAHDLRLIDPNPNDVSLCFLPLSHVFERAWTFYTLFKGMVNNYLDDPKKIIEFIQEVKPTIMCAVPRFYEKIYATVFNRLESAPPAKKKLFKWAVGVGAAYGNRKKDGLFISPLLRVKHALADRLVLGKIREIVGGRIKFFPCAGAPLSQEIEEFFYAAGIFICYGYGLTETTATVTCHEPGNFRFGLVGKPMPGVQVKIADNGEILVKGPTVMKGYYKKPKETAEVFSDGWFKTGDAGHFEDNGELRITERIKDLMKTSGGKYIAPQMIESTIGADLYIEQIAVIGDNRKYVTALVVPSFEALGEYAKAHGIPFTSREDIIKNPAVLEFYGRRIDEQQRELAGFEKVKKFTLLPTEFTVDGGDMTPTMKIRRKVVAEKYKAVIDTMYHDL